VSEVAVGEGLKELRDEFDAKLRQIKEVTQKEWSKRMAETRQNGTETIQQGVLDGSQRIPLQGVN
jgi:hypothetical protein